MLRVLLALGLWLAGLGFASAQWIGPPNLTLCNKMVSFTGTGSIASLISSTPRTMVLICGWNVTATGASTFTFTFGTQTTTPCDTGAVAITPTLNVTTNANVDHQQYSSQSSPVGAGVCVNAGTTVTGMLYYTTVSTSQ